MLDIKKLSYWERKSFFDDIDYLIIGAGIVGYSTALSLRELNPEAKIVVIERGYLPSGASSKNAGFACFGSATELIADLQTMPEKEVWETVALRWKGLQKLKSLIGENDLGLIINGSWDLIVNSDTKLYDEAVEKLDYLNENIEIITGEKEAYLIDNQCNEKFSLNDIHSSIYNRLEGQIDTSQMNSAFHKKVVAKNISVLFGIEAKEISSTEEGAIVTTNIGEITTKKVAVCTNGFAKQFFPEEDVQPARAQVLVTKPIKDLKIKGTFHYDSGYYYFRNIDGRILLGGGRNLDFEGETTTELENSSKIMEKLHELLKNVILPNTDYEIDYQWAGIMGVGKSKKPIIKECQKNVFCGIRLGGMGVAIGTLVGEELAGILR
ncbi:MAG: FAD-binding oxidoreductase [Fluviicola sp.]|nr:FAD-binding oxidoreductase [Fluviicola sp.]